MEESESHQGQAFDVQGNVDETAHLIADALTPGKAEDIIKTLGYALLREDSGFHQFQMFEAGVRQWSQYAGQPAGDHILIGVSRFLTAHSPTVRARGQTFDIASRLHWGESLHGEDELT